MVSIVAFIALAPAFTSWRAPWPRVWTSDDGGFALSVTPGKLNGSRVSLVKLHLFAINTDGKQLSLWRSESDFYPNHVKISPDARVVMFNEYPGYSQKTAVAIFSDTGAVIARFPVGELLTKEQFDSIPGNEGLKPKVWMDHATFESVRNLVHPPRVAPQPEVRTVGELVGLSNSFPYALKVQTVVGPALWFDLMTGKRTSQ